ncbi:tripartite tricarboxylate transporter substrate binding protein [Spirochaeta isovalerica]|uniref:Putative tricarboxylic transport membrane protein n=1 Tax=Spirochaeta isovalerica TaxID=150 RepID=A0A841R8D5_9SPIO|nr:tripartite tricarboxylate transporter substrate-binding protein [Spirochaeta isovalerica]MBB6480076.1 putative tricarboxylic transport membrane protein [Spirochaeta isovalerica]
MKKILTALLMTALVSGFAFAEGKQDSPEASGPWTPQKVVEWVVTSSAGGGSSIFTQTITEIIKNEGLVDQNIVINYKTDGGGAVGRRMVSTMKNEAHTLLTFNSGDLQPMVQMEGGDLDGLTPLAVMALDGQIILVNKNSEYKTINDIINALKNGKRMIMGGSKSDDEAIYNAMKKEVGGDMEYLRSDSTGEALTQLLGGHVDMAIAKPAASFDLVKSGELLPVVAAGGSRFADPFDAPTFKELGYDIEFEIYRGIVGPADMPAAAVEFWTEVFRKVSQSDSWKNDYISKFLLVSNFKGGDEARAYMQKFEDMYTGN